jgi:hypothetical protein
MRESLDPDPNVMIRRATHPSKQAEQRNWTDEGMQISASDEQLANAST